MYKNIADSFKEISYDLIGFFIPGFAAIVLVFTLLDPNVLRSISDTEFISSFNELLIIVFSYLLGYVAMGISEFVKGKMKKDYSNVIESEIERSALFKKALRKYSLHSEMEEELSLRQLRTRIMSFIPEADGKIYDFRFRSDLCENTIRIISLIIILTIPVIVAQFFGYVKILREPLMTIVFLLILIVLLMYFIGLTRNRYYSISMRVPLSIYLSKS